MTKASDLVQKPIQKSLNCTIPTQNLQAQSSGEFTRMHKSSRSSFLVSLVSLLIISAIAPAFTLRSVKADPYMNYESVATPTWVTPIKIEIISPLQDSVFSNNGNITLCFSVTSPDSPRLLTKSLSTVDYQGDWVQNLTHAYRTKNFDTYTPDDFPTFLNFSFPISRIPLGPHTLVVTATGFGGYADGLTWCDFQANASLTINFTIAKTPAISFLLTQNTTFESAAVPLNFTVDAPTKRITYSLDGALNETATGNTTLTGLRNGLHNVTIYASDNFGNTGVSEIFNFTIAQPVKEYYSGGLGIPVLTYACAVVLVAGLIVYLAKKKTFKG